MQNGIHLVPKFNVGNILINYWSLLCGPVGPMEEAMGNHKLVHFGQNHVVFCVVFFIDHTQKYVNAMKFNLLSSVGIAQNPKSSSGFDFPVFIVKEL